MWQLSLLFSLINTKPQIWLQRCPIGVKCVEEGNRISSLEGYWQLVDSLGSPVINVANLLISWTSSIAQWFQVPPVSIATGWKMCVLQFIVLGDFVWRCLVCRWICLCGSVANMWFCISVWDSDTPGHWINVLPYGRFPFCWIKLASSFVAGICARFTVSFCLKWWFFWQERLRFDKRYRQVSESESSFQTRCMSISISIYSARAYSSIDAIRGATRIPVLLVHVTAKVKCLAMRFKSR